MAVKARWNNALIAQSDQTVLVEGNHYFPLEDVYTNVIEITELFTHCTWKGDANYYSIVVDGERNEAAAWYYSAPHEAASMIKSYVAFWKGIRVTGSNPGAPEILPPRHNGGVG